MISNLIVHRTASANRINWGYLSIQYRLIQLNFGQPGRPEGCYSLGEFI